MRCELTVAGIPTLAPRVINVCVALAPTILIPRTTRSAATESAGFLVDPAFGALGTTWRCWCSCVGTEHRETDIEAATMWRARISAFTFAGIGALGPRVISIRSTVLEPSSAGCATTDPARLREGAAFRATATGLNCTKRCCSGRIGDP